MVGGGFIDLSTNVNGAKREDVWQFLHLSISWHQFFKADVWEATFGSLKICGAQEYACYIWVKIEDTCMWDN